MRRSLSYHRLLAVATFSCVLVLCGCPQRTAVWVEAGSTANHLVLKIGKSRGVIGGVAVGVVRVDRCANPTTGAGAMWVVGPQHGTADMDSLVYGVAPDGFVSDQGPQSLTPGCYRVSISGTGRVSFAIDSIGHVTELPP